MTNKYENDIEAMDKARFEKAESKMARIVMLTNHIGKLKKKKSARGRREYHAPKGFINTRKTKFTNYGGALGMTDDEYREWKKTGTLPERLKNKEGN